jgi:hypothetical protein
MAVVALVAGACGGGGSDGSAPAAPTSSGATSTTATAPIEGVDTIVIAATGHSDAPQTYPQVPPAGGIHNPVWAPCAFYDKPIENEKGVHSLEHGAIWITYRPDASRADLDVVTALVRGSKKILASPWVDGLPAPLVATAWGRQLRLQSAADPRLARFIGAYTNQSPEPAAPC